MSIIIKNLPDYRKIASQIKKEEVKVTPEEIERLKTEKERVEKERVRREIIDKISEQTEAEISPGLIEREGAAILDGLKQQVSQILRISFDDYLKKINKTERELSDSLLPEAKKRLTNFLVLHAIAEKENIHVHDGEVQKEMEVILKSFPNARDVDKEQLKEYTEKTIVNEKVFQILENL